ncbi:hypothetical protein MMC28_006363 [Mycoblastus sanguinarius]|nr:hypothetical protein [Mycoblastus sanguinarius]
MREIYYKAEKLSILLGPANPKPILAFRTLDGLSAHARRLDQDGMEEALLDILERPWWGRIWVVQEVVAFGEKVNVRSKACIRYGTEDVSWTDLVHACQNMLKAKSEYGMPVAHARKIMRSEEIRSTLHHNPHHSSLPVNFSKDTCSMLAEGVLLDKILQVSETFILRDQKSSFYEYWVATYRNLIALAQLQ